MEHVVWHLIDNRNHEPIIILVCIELVLEETFFRALAAPLVGLTLLVIFFKLGLEFVPRFFCRILCLICQLLKLDGDFFGIEFGFFEGFFVGLTNLAALAHFEIGRLPSVL